MLETNKIHNYNCLEGLKLLDDNSVDCCVTSPPYWSLRDYNIEGQLGLESTFNEYVTNLCDIFDEVKRVLKKEGTCWVNIGDTYASSGGPSRHKGYTDPKYINGRNGSFDEPSSNPQEGASAKSLCQIPSRFSIEMTNRGWLLRNEIIWHKPAAMPSSAKDRFTVDFEKIFFFTKQQRYFFNQQTTPCKDNSIKRAAGVYTGNYAKEGHTAIGTKEDYGNTNRFAPEQGANLRTTWSINFEPSREEHYAQYPQLLIEIPIKAGCPIGGVVLDPFMGSGTTAVVARKLERNFIGFELNPKYIKIAENRLYQELGMFL